MEVCAVPPPAAESAAGAVAAAAAAEEATPEDAAVPHSGHVAKTSANEVPAAHSNEPE